MKKERGFTIVELLIVIVILGILATLIIVSYNGIQERARSVKRSADINIMTKWLEQYYANRGVYPASAVGSTYLVTPDRITATTTKAQLKVIMGTGSTIQDPVDLSNYPFITSGYTTLTGKYFYFGGYYYSGPTSTSYNTRFGTRGVITCGGSVVLNTANRYASSVVSYYDTGSDTIQIYTSSSGVKPSSRTNTSKCIWH